LIRYNKPGVAVFRLANGYGALRDALDSDAIRFQRLARFGGPRGGAPGEFGGFKVGAPVEVHRDEAGFCQELVTSCRVLLTQVKETTYKDPDLSMNH
ncbi:hypothetical protein MKW92_010009, partial [Papaver armeniacum]